MAELLKGNIAANRILEETSVICNRLKAMSVTPTLQIIRCGEREDDKSYERSILKSAEKYGVSVLVSEISMENFDAKRVSMELEAEIDRANNDDSVHGILMFRPLPKELNEKAIIELIDPTKDVDGVTSASMSFVYSGEGFGFEPCTPKACMKVLEAYDIPVEGKKVAIVGRSLVVGKPLAMMMIRENATVTVCHTRTKDLKAVTKDSDVVVACCGVPELIDETYFEDHTIALDVGIHFKDGKMCGDIKSDAYEKIDAVTPVPGGVGAVTTAVLMEHVIKSADDKVEQ